MTTQIKHILILCLLSLLIHISLAQSPTLNWKALTFDNPGTKRVLKTDKTAYYFYRSLPEKTMILKVKDLSTVEIRAISTKKIEKPQFTIIIDNKKTVFSLNLLAVSEKYYVFEPVKITLTPGLQNIELLCYDRHMYFRAFYPSTVVKKKKHVPPLNILTYKETVPVSANTHSNKYYVFDSDKSISFSVSEGRKVDLYIRAQLKEKKVPVLEIYKDGNPFIKVFLSLKRTKTYKAEGIEHLTVGKKVELPPSTENASYEIKALTDHTFLVRPVIRKQ